MKDTDDCPCESGKPIEECLCFRSGYFYSPTAQTKIIPTNNRIQGCYASAMGGCGGALTKEHYISHGTLKMLGDGKTVTVSRYLPQRNEQLTQVLGTESLSAKVLCDNHNNALSNLDFQGNRFFDRLTQLIRPQAITQPVSGFNGYDIERWLLKTACGQLASGTAAHDNIGLEKWSPPKEIIEVIYGIEHLPEAWGLYVLSTPKKLNFGFSPLINKVSGPQPRFQGCIMTIAGIQFLLAMTQPSDNNEDEESLLKGAIYRPSELILNDGAVKILLGWQKPHQGNKINFSWKTH